MSYPYRSKVRISVAFSDFDGELIDPDDVFCQTKIPGAEISSYQYGVDIEVVRDSIGSYHMDINCEAPGNYYYAWYSTGYGQSSQENKFKVSESQFD